MQSPALRRVQVYRSDILNAYVQRHFPMLGRTFRAEYVALHAWRRGGVELSAEEAATVLALKAGSAPSAAAWAALRDRLPPEFFDEEPVDIQGLVDRAATHFPALQNYRELARFLAQVVARPPRVVVEIGTASGGMFHALCQTAQPDAEIISIDLAPARALGDRCQDVDRAVFGSFAWAAQRCHFIRGSSLAYSTLQALKDQLAGRRIDLLFIDGCHEYAAVKSDFERYSDLVAPDGRIALHDIAVFPQSHGAGMDVGVVWNEIKAQYPAHEIIEPAGARSLVAWRARMQQLVEQHPRLADPQGKISLRERLAQDLGSDLLQPASGPRATSYQTVLDIPAEVQMAWGIGVVDRAASQSAGREAAS